jgi:GxxExxY protein
MEFALLKKVEHGDTNYTNFHEKMANHSTKRRSFKLIGSCMEVHREPARAMMRSIYKDALEIEFQRQGLCRFRGNRNTKSITKACRLPHFYFADFVVLEKILLEAKAWNN